MPNTLSIGNKETKGNKMPHPNQMKGTPEYDAWVSKIKEARKNQVYTDETRQKLSESRKGRVLNPESRKKISDAQKGKPRWTDEDKARMSETRKGKKQPPEVTARRIAASTAALRRPEARVNLSRAQRGKIATDRMRVRASETHKGKEVSEETRAKLLGYKHTNIAKAKMSEKQAERWEQKTDEQKTSQIERILTASQKITHSYIEKLQAQKLDDLGITYEHQKMIGWYKVDFYIPSENKVIEVNGCYWHACESCHQKGKPVVEKYEQKRGKDAKRYEYLRRKGYIVEVTWEHDFPRKR